MSEKKKSLIGGQAVMEGVMMRGNNRMAMAVRRPDGEISLKRYNTKKIKTSKIPFIRGVLNFVAMMKVGVECLLNSAEIAEGGITDEPSKFEKWISKKTGKDSMDIMMGFAVVLGISFSVFLFIVLPNLLANALALFIETPILINIGEGVIRLSIFIGYLAIISLIPDMKRFFAYHGAEHKTINCYEAGLIITPENAKKQTKAHTRCGTSFMLLVLVISIVLFTLTGWTGAWWGRVLIRLALLPIVASFAYEMLMGMAKHENLLVKILRWPGMQLQKLTTNEPDLEMLEVAIAAFAACMPEDERLKCLPEGYRIPGDKITINEAFNAGIKLLNEAEYKDGEISAKWLMKSALNNKYSDLISVGENKLSLSAEKKFNSYIGMLLSGQPVQYIIGEWDFLDLKIITDKRALIPRPETEILANEVNKLLVNTPNAKIIDIGCGTGCIGLYLKSKNPDIDLTLADISADALNLATENAAKLKLESTFKIYDMENSLNEIYDVIVSNPPYIKTEDIKSLDYHINNAEPISALDGGADGLRFYRALAVRALQSLSKGGIIAIELGMGQLDEVKALFNAKAFTISVIKDLNQIDRVLIAKRDNDGL